MCCESRAQQGKERLIFFPGKDSANENHRLFTRATLAQLCSKANHRLPSESVVSEAVLRVIAQTAVES